MQRPIRTASLVLLAAAFLPLLAPGVADAGVVVHRHDGPAPERSAGAPPPGRVLRPKVDEEARSLFLPAFAVDAENPGGRTTLFAVRNVDLAPRDVTVQFVSPEGVLLDRLDLTLGSEQTFTKNVRDQVHRFGPLPEGLVRGFVQITQDPEVAEPYLVGDFFQVDVDGAFATGDRLLAPEDFCQVQEIRVLDFGSGAELTFFVLTPLGDDDQADPPTVTAEVIAEAGEFQGEVEIFTDMRSFVLSSDELTDLDFGTLVFDFTNGAGGVVLAEYSADGLFSVGLNSACRVPAPE